MREVLRDLFELTPNRKRCSDTCVPLVSVSAMNPKQCLNPECQNETRYHSNYCSQYCVGKTPGFAQPSGFAREMPIEDLAAAEKIGGYSEFRRKLTTKPKWIARAIMVLTYDPSQFGITETDSLMVEFAVDIKRNGGKELPYSLETLDGKKAVDLVRRFAPRLYRHSLMKAQN